MALYEAILTQEYFSQLIVNRFAYQSNVDLSGNDGALALARAMGYVTASNDYDFSLLLGRIANIQVTSVNFVNLDVINLYNPVDFVSLPFAPANTGQASGEGMSPVLAYGFSSNRVRRDINRGQKRFVGVSETYSDAGGVVDEAFYDAALTQVATFLGIVLSGSPPNDSVTFTPVVLGVQKYTTPSGREAYRKYPTEAEQLEHVSSGLQWTPKREVRTQTTRQYRRGQ